MRWTIVVVLILSCMAAAPGGFDYDKSHRTPPVVHHPKKPPHPNWPRPYERRQPLVVAPACVPEMTLIFDDEFDGRKLNTDLWEAANDAGFGGQSFSPAQVAVKDGKLEITHTGTVSGFVTAKPQSYLYGFFEARIKAAPVFPGLCTAFWSWNKTDTIWTEIDFCELCEASFGGTVGSPRQIDTVAHVFYEPGVSGTPLQWIGSYMAKTDPRHHFHVYGCWWTATDITWYFDGQIIYHQPNQYWTQQALDVVCDTELRPLADGGFPATAYYDYVRIWQ